MTFLYFDESIREIGDFVIGAMVLSEEDLSVTVGNLWRTFGLDPETHEYKSSDIKKGNELGRRQRDELGQMLQHLGLALTVCPKADRQNLGVHCCSLILQLLDTGFINAGNSNLYIDQGILVPHGKRTDLEREGIVLHTNQDSRIVSGLQVADHAAHFLGGMLLEVMGAVRKTVPANDGSNTVLSPGSQLGFELWASLRYSLLGRNEVIEGLSVPGEVNPYFRIEGFGLYVAPSCGQELATFIRQCFGTNYLGCID